MRLYLIVACLTFTSESLAVTSDAADPVSIMGFETTSRGRSLVERAAALTNDILGQRSRFRLVVSWQRDPGNIDLSSLIRLYAVSPSQKHGDFNIMVPYDCNCIFVQPKIFRERLTKYFNASPQMLKFDERYALTFMLLHEVGHIEHGDPGKYEDKQKAHTYNFDKTDQKEIESSADDFAADMLIAAAEDKKNFIGWAASLNTQMSLTKISWNLSVIRHLNNFGASVLCSKIVFSDDGYTHPNYELRVLTANDRIAHTTTSAELLKSFEACRIDPAKSTLRDR
jgi:hypothetical protein